MRARAARPARQDSIMNGADDDGSGSMVLLELAEKFAKEKPSRSILFISHQGEEGGLLGSRWFVDNPTVPIDKIAEYHDTVLGLVAKHAPNAIAYGFGHVGDGNLHFNVQAPIGADAAAFPQHGGDQQRVVAGSAAVLAHRLGRDARPRSARDPPHARDHAGTRGPAGCGDGAR